MTETRAPIKTSLPLNLGQDLAQSLAEIWAILEQAVQQRNDSLHTLCVASVDAAGLPQARHVVLRHVDAVQRCLRFHIDMRSPKAEQMAAQPRIAMLGYDPLRRLQIRLSALAHLHLDDSIAAAAWQACQPMSRACYRTAQAPSTALLSSYLLDADARAQQEAARQNLELGRENFCVVRAEILQMDWLYLAMDGHKRGYYDFSGKPAPTDAQTLPQGWGHWLMP